MSEEVDDLISELSSDLATSRSARVIIPCTHIYLEHLMNQILEQNLPAVEYQRIQTDRHFGFRRKLDRLQGMQREINGNSYPMLSNDEFNDLDLINEIRNDFVHNLKPDLEIINQKIFDGLHFHVFNPNRNPVEAILYDMVQLMELLGSKIRH